MPLILLFSNIDTISKTMTTINTVNELNRFIKPAEPIDSVISRLADNNVIVAHSVAIYLHVTLRSKPSAVYPLSH